MTVFWLGVAACLILQFLAVATFFAWAARPAPRAARPPKPHRHAFAGCPFCPLPSAPGDPIGRCRLCAADERLSPRADA